MFKAEVFVVLFPEIAALEIMRLIDDFQRIFLFCCFDYQMLRRLIKHAVISTLHWGVQLLSQSF